MPAWTVDGPHGPLTVRPTVALRCDTVQFFFRQPGPPRPAYVERALDGPCVPVRYVEDHFQVGWVPDPSEVLDPEVSVVRDFVNELPVETLLSICRGDAALRVLDARSDVARHPKDPGTLDQLRLCLAYEAALNIDDPTVRRAAVDLAHSWRLPSELLVAAAKSVVQEPDR